MTDGQIEKEREQVKKLMGAKSAMEAALSRINTLESAMREMHLRYSELAKCIGDDAYILSKYPKGLWTNGERQMTSVGDLKKGIDGLLHKHTGPVS